LTDDVLYTGEENDAGVGLGRRPRLLDTWTSLLHIVVKRVRNSTARFCFAFYSTGGPAYDSVNTCIFII